MLTDFHKIGFEHYVTGEHYSLLLFNFHNTRFPHGGRLR